MLFIPRVYTKCCEKKHSVGGNIVLIIQIKGKIARFKLPAQINNNMIMKDYLNTHFLQKWLAEKHPSMHEIVNLAVDSLQQWKTTLGFFLFWDIF